MLMRSDSCYVYYSISPAGMQQISVKNTVGCCIQQKKYLRHFVHPAIRPVPPSRYGDAGFGNGAMITYLGKVRLQFLSKEGLQA